MTLSRRDAHSIFAFKKVCPQAKLNIRSAGNKIVLSWPDSLVGYQVEASENFFRRRGSR